MAKASSPLRIQEDLMRAAKLTGERFHRSTAEQVEYWAEIGRQVTDVVDPDTLLSIKSGLARLNVEPVYSQPLDADKIFNSLEKNRKNGTLTESVSSAVEKYQTSLTHPGYLERITQDGKVDVGKFMNGEFVLIENIHS